MRELFRTFPLMCVVLLVPILPFLFFGGQLEQWLRGISENPPSPIACFGLVVALLSTDILLPIPSSVISTLSGWQLGLISGTAATWLGMNLGAILGFGLARKWGQPFALWFSKSEDLERMQVVNQQYGPFVLVLTRAMPVFAEASVLIAGIHQLSWRRFLPAILLSNLGIALAYAWFGDYAERNQWLPFALGIAIAVPILVAAIAKSFLPRATVEEIEKESSKSKFES
ncbi:MAG: VTT domain-containing protein [Planctomycetota bacterium]